MILILLIQQRRMSVLITGPQWVGPNYFAHFYVPQIYSILAQGTDIKFVLGDADGVDQLAQAYLAKHVTPKNVTVYIKHGKQARLVHPEFKVDDVAPSYPERDLRMAGVSSVFIAVLPQFGGGTTGALVPLMVPLMQNRVSGEQNANCAALSIVERIRQFSEPADKDLTAVVSALYEAWYAPDAALAVRVRAKMAEALKTC